VGAAMTADCTEVKVRRFHRVCIAVTSRGVDERTVRVEHAGRHPASVGNGGGGATQGVHGVMT
jgi:hypothetical protein